jgi:hypothetical protein
MGVRGECAIIDSIGPRLYLTTRLIIDMSPVKLKTG